MFTDWSGVHPASRESFGPSNGFEDPTYTAELAQRDVLASWVDWGVFTKKKPCEPKDWPKTCPPFFKGCVKSFSNFWVNVLKLLECLFKTHAA